MIIYYSQEELVAFIRAEIRAWEAIGGGPNINAFDLSNVLSKINTVLFSVKKK